MAIMLQTDPSMLVISLLVRRGVELVVSAQVRELEIDTRFHR
jgi:hypothetical protein